ncbi:hypothetical protein PSH79_08565 [Pseudomonas sp. FP2196]|uniref:hypothetical protein n=1 Tax=Pseudomonas sp. FP2196 TaxID=2954086 RepID=UPI0027342F6C|nr:hypothetical protein [Pseudomonas sp. FP2196]WLH37341.1 hypothetical protein PSH79_08565 [Pseudomonas sp. FP2196]
MFFITREGFGANPIAFRESDPMPSIPPETVTPAPAEDADALSFMAANPAFLSSDDAAACLHGLLKTPQSSELHWFILKSGEGQFFCAPRIDATVSGDEALHRDVATVQRLVLAVTVSATEPLTIPKGFTLEASFHARPSKAKAAEEAIAEWVQRNRFFTMSDLSAVMSARRKYSKCYLSVRNGGLISYTSTNLPFETELSPQLMKTLNGQPRRFESLYEDGAVPSSVWILLALAAGEVSVVVPGDLWRHRGQLKASWRSDILTAQPAIERVPIFGPICRDAKDVAAYLRSKLPASLSAYPNVGFVLKHNASNFFVVTEPVSSHYASFDRAVLFPRDQHGNPLIPAEFRVHGIYHSIQPLPVDQSASDGGDLYQNFFSPADLKVGLDRLSVAPHQRIFAITPDGAVLRFAKPIMPKVLALTTELAQDLEQKIISGDMSPQTYVNKVADAGTLSVLLASKTWAHVGRVTASFSTDVTDAPVT